MRKPWWRRGWWWKVPLALAALLLFLAPSLATPWAHRALEEQLEEQLGGTASLDEFSLSWPAGFELSGLSVEDTGGRPVLELASLEGALSLSAFLSGRVAVEARLDAAEAHLQQQADGSWQLGSLTLAPAADASGEPTIPEEPASGDGTNEEPEPGSPETSEPLPPMSGEFSLTNTRVVLHGLDGEVTLEGLELTGSLPEDPAELSTFHAAFDAHGEGGPAGSLRADGKLVLGPLHAIAPGEIEATLSVDRLTLAALRPALALWLPERIPSGSIDASFQLAGQPDHLRLGGTTTIRELVVEILAQDEDEEPLVLRDPEVTLELQAELAPEALDLDLRELQLDSRFARLALQGRVLGLGAWGAGAGSLTFDGLAGEVSFVPDRLIELLGEDLPIQLAGPDERRITFALDGDAKDLDVESLLRDCVASATVELGNFATTGIQGSGDLQLEAQDGRARWQGTLLANEGKLDLTGGIEIASLGDSEGDSKAQLVVDTEDLATNAELAPLLSLLHPAFAAIQGIQNSAVAGLVTSHLELEYEGSLGTTTLDAGWDAFPKQGIHGRGSFTITGARLDATASLTQMLGYLGLDTARSVDIRPVEFAIDAGRLTYSNPWTWTIDDIETTFTGSVGLDQTLDLAWNVPVTDEVADEHRVLRSLKGTIIQLPIRGTVKRPELDWQDALAQFAEGDLKDELLERLGVGEGDGIDDPNDLLAEADRLWDDGQKVEAAAIYKRLREDFKVSLTYALNRDRIKKRGKYRE